MPNLQLLEQLSFLYELQQVDVEILSLHRKLRSVPLKIKTLQEDLNSHRQKLEEKQEQLAEAEKRQRTKTAELQMQQEQGQKYQAQLREVKTNKEYKALDNEISFLEEKKAGIEDEILSAMLHIDQLNEELDHEKQIFKDEESKCEKQKAQYQQEAESLKQQIEAYQEKRREFVRQIESNLLEEYQERFKRQRTGIVSQVVNGSCSNCNLRVPPQTLQEARKYEQYITCNSCKRILYIPPAPPDESSAEDSESA